MKPSVMVALAAALLALVHGGFELSRGAAPLPGIRFCATGGPLPAVPSAASMSRCLPAESLLPNYASAGMVTILLAVGLAVASMRIRSSRARGLALIGLAIALGLAGGGNFAPIIAAVVGVTVLVRRDRSVAGA